MWGNSVCLFFRRPPKQIVVFLLMSLSKHQQGDTLKKTDPTGNGLQDSKSHIQWPSVFVFFFFFFLQSLAISAAAFA